MPQSDSDVSSHIIFGNCFDEFERHFGFESVDMILTDPPYGMTQNAWDKQVDLPAFWHMARRILKPKGVVASFCCQPFTSHLLLSNEKMFQCEWILHKTKKTGFLNASRLPLRSHESVLIFAEPGHLYQPQITTGHKPVNSFTKKKNSDGTNYGATSVVRGGGQTTRYPESVLRVPWIGSTAKERVGHPQQKPVSILKYFINTYTRPGMLVVDMFMGSGSTGVACAELGRSFVGFENYRQYFDMAIARLPNAVIVDSERGLEQVPERAPERVPERGHGQDRLAHEA